MENCENIHDDARQCSEVTPHPCTDPGVCLPLSHWQRGGVGVKAGDGRRREQFAVPLGQLVAGALGGGGLQVVQAARLVLDPGILLPRSGGGNAAWTSKITVQMRADKRPRGQHKTLKRKSLLQNAKFIRQNKAYFAEKKEPPK